MKHWKQNNPGHCALGVSRRADPQATGRTGRWSAGTSWCVLSYELLSPTVTQKEVMFKGSPLFFHPLSNAPLSLGPKESSLLQPSSNNGKSVPCLSSTNSAPCCKAAWKKNPGESPHKPSAGEGEGSQGDSRGGFDLVLGAINVPWDVFRMPWAFIWCSGIPHHTAFWAASYREKPARHFLSLKGEMLSASEDQILTGLINPDDVKTHQTHLS